jgi:mono/diheme cytochrome c family protein
MNISLPVFSIAGFFLLNMAASAGDPAVLDDRIKPVEYYKDVRGSIVFKTYCVLCHGTKADGKGRASKNYVPEPANLTVSTRSDDYKEKIIRKGGVGVGRSPFMPPWEQELTNEQIRDVVYYLKVINIKYLDKAKGL